MRTTKAIAYEIEWTWQNPYFGAVPYIHALTQLENGKYGCEDEEDLINRFLCNAGSWRGPDARRIKADLKERLKSLNAR